MKLNDEINKKISIFIIVLFILFLISIFLYIYLIKPSIVTKGELKNEYEEYINSVINDDKQISSNDKEIIINKDIYDNVKYDKYYNSLVEITNNYNFNYLYLNNYYPEYSGQYIYPMISEGNIVFNSINDLQLIALTINTNLINFEYSNETNECKFSNLFLFDNSYSQKNIEIDNREDEANSQKNDFEDENNIESKENIINSNIVSDKDEVIKNINKSIFHFNDKYSELNIVPMNENLFLDVKRQIAPIINKDAIVVNAINKSDKDSFYLLDMSKLEFKLYCGDIDIYLDEFNYDNEKLDKFLYYKDNNGTEYNIKGDSNNGKTVFKIDGNLQFPIDILGIKYRVETGKSTSNVVVKLGYEINKNKYEDFLKNGNFATVLKYKDIDIDEFIIEIGGNINRDEFIKDNAITKENYKNIKIFMVRFRALYEIKEN